MTLDPRTCKCASISTIQDSALSLFFASTTLGKTFCGCLNDTSCYFSTIILSYKLLKDVEQVFSLEESSIMTRQDFQREVNDFTPLPGSGNDVSGALNAIRDYGKFSQIVSTIKINFQAFQQRMGGDRTTKFRLFWSSSPMIYLLKIITAAFWMSRVSSSHFLLTLTFQF